MPPIRAFIAFETPYEIRDEIYALQSQLKNSQADVRWEFLEKFHVTIKFLGNVDEQALPDVISSIETALGKYTCFDVTYQGLGAFPNLRNPRVIWVSCVNADGILEKAKNELDDALLPLGFEKEDRTFHPHITLGRVKSSKRLKNLTPMLEKLTFEPRSTTISEILVMKSVLKPEGSVYSILKSIQLQQ
ncbi:MAG: RNA 2',3'-cyclic phosphodiesterase [Ignavibacteriae bacterium]|nr:RNA 2',3'-cyclic phosphodiesterase [Ignavibacteriota bacterium]